MKQTSETMYVPILGYLKNEEGELITADKYTEGSVPLLGLEMMNERRQHEIALERIRAHPEYYGTPKEVDKKIARLQRLLAE